MSLTEKLIKEGIQNDDTRLFGVEREILELIMDNPFSERMMYLLQNQQLAKIPVENSYSQMSPPNCIGTGLFVSSLSRFSHPYHAYFNELSPHLSKTPESDHDDDFETRIFNFNQSFSQHYERMIPGAFAVAHSYDADTHLGIYLGKIDGLDVLFAQHGWKGKFGPETLRNYDSPTYYFPKTLFLCTKVDHNLPQHS